MEHANQPSVSTVANGAPSRAVRFLLRAVLGGLVAVLVCLWALNLGNRGFLPSTGRELWLEIAEDGSLISVREGDLNAVPAARAGVWRVFLDEHGMGRIHGPAASWRSTAWLVRDAYGPDGAWLDPDPKKPEIARLDGLLDPIVRAEIIPTRRVLPGWENVPSGRLSHDAPGGWRMFQHRSRPVVFAAIVAMSLGLGLLVGKLVPLPGNGAGSKAAPSR